MPPKPSTVLRIVSGSGSALSFKQEIIAAINLIVSGLTGRTLTPMPLGRGATFLVAANDASARMKVQADYLCDGTADEDQIQASMAALP